MGYCTTLNQCRMSSPTFGPHSGKLCIGSIWPAACCWGRTNEPRRPHTRQFFVPFLGYLSDPFKGYSWPPTGDQKGHGLNHKGQFPTANVSLSCQARRMYPQLIDLNECFWTLETAEYLVSLEEVLWANNHATCEKSSSLPNALLCFAGLMIHEVGWLVAVVFEITE